MIRQSGVSVIGRSEHAGCSRPARPPRRRHRAPSGRYLLAGDSVARGPGRCTAPSPGSRRWTARPTCVVDAWRARRRGAAGPEPCAWSSRSATRRSSSRPDGHGARSRSPSRCSPCSSPSSRSWRSSRCTHGCVRWRPHAPPGSPATRACSAAPHPPPSGPGPAQRRQRGRRAGRRLRALPRRCSPRSTPRPAPATAASPSSTATSSRPAVVDIVTDPAVRADLFEGYAPTMLVVDAAGRCATGRSSTRTPTAPRSSAGSSVPPIGWRRERSSDIPSAATRRRTPGRARSSRGSGTCGRPAGWCCAGCIVAAAAAALVPLDWYLSRRARAADDGRRTEYIECAKGSYDAEPNNWPAAAPPSATVAGAAAATRARTATTSKATTAGRRRCEGTTPRRPPSATAATPGGGRATAAPTR